MSEAIKPTPGPWEASRNDEAVCGQWSIRVPGQHPVVSYEIAEITGYRIDGSDEIDARLMAEAGTVAHETGLTPRQLVEQRDALVERVKELEEALTSAQQAINSMKVEAETAAQGDEQMMLEACETISNEGLQADMEIRAALSKVLPNTVAEVQ